jgi:hypothetical protein
MQTTFRAVILQYHAGHHFGLNVREVLVDFMYHAVNIQLHFPSVLQPFRFLAVLFLPSFPS